MVSQVSAAGHGNPGSGTPACQAGLRAAPLALMASHQQATTKVRLPFWPIRQQTAIKELGSGSMAC